MGTLRGFAVLVLLAPAPAWADESVAPVDDSAPAVIPSETGAQPVGSTRAGHHRQFGLSAQMVSGSRFIKTWDPADYCGDRGESSTGNAVYCFSRVPVTLDLTATYGIRPNIELMFEMRFGLERDFGATSSSGNGPRMRHYSPGVRFFFNDKGLMKFFSTAQIALDSTGYKDASNESRGVDFALRNANGIFLDFHDAYGAYVFFGEELEFKRWLEAGLELGVGIQGRYP
jgi:hypothetical protein